jgi:hypothetical protein
MWQRRLVMLQPKLQSMQDIRARTQLKLQRMQPGPQADLQNMSPQLLAMLHLTRLPHKDRLPLLLAKLQRPQVLWQVANSRKWQG